MPSGYQKLVLYSGMGTAFNDSIKGNSFFLYGTRSIIFYYEPSPYPEIREYLATRHHAIRESVFARKRFYFNPGLLTSGQIQSLVSFCFPFINHRMRGKLGDFVKLAGDYEFLVAGLGINPPSVPCFIVQERYSRDYELFHLPVDKENLSKAVDYFLRSLTFPREENSISYSRKPRIRIDDFHHAPIEVRAELLEAMKKLMDAHQDAPAVEFLAALLTELNNQGRIHDPKLKAISESFHNYRETELSPLYVRSNGDLFLKDYGLTIQLTPLQKTVYIFFLHHPEGIIFKELISYHAELLEIYKRFATRKDGELLLDSVAALSNPYSNSMSEKCSRIKEAFLKNLGDGIARNYYVMGDRQDYKKITLPRNLVVFEN